MRTRRYIHRDGRLTDDGNGWNQFAAEDAGRVAGKRSEERGRHSGGEVRQLGERVDDVDCEHGQRGSREPERGGRVGGGCYGPVGRADDKGGGVAAGDRERNVQRLGQRGGGQDGGRHAGLDDCGFDLCRVLEAATLALAHLDSDALGELERRAKLLQAKIESGSPLVAVPELVARHRVFAAVVEATGDSLGVFRRTDSRGLYGNTRLRNPWAL